MSEIRPIDKAIEILSRTNDGNDLSPTHLTLMDYAANGFLNEKGLEKLDEIYQQVIAGEYRMPYLQGVEFMTNSQNVLVENNWIYQIYDTGVTHQGSGTYHLKGFTVRKNLMSKKS